MHLGSASKAQDRWRLPDGASIVAFRAAWSACLLGDRSVSVRALAATAQQPGPLAERALALALIACPFDEARKLAQRAWPRRGGALA